MSKQKTMSNSRKHKQENSPAPHGEVQPTAGGELHQIAGGEYHALTTNQGVALSDNQNSLRATRVDYRGISASQIPPKPIDRVAALRFGFNPGTISDESLHPPICQPVHQTA